MFSIFSIDVFPKEPDEPAPAGELRRRAHGGQGGPEEEGGRRSHLKVCQEKRQQG